MNADSLWFIFYDGALLLVPDTAAGALGAAAAAQDGLHRIPRFDAPPLPPAGMLHQLGLYRGVPCVAYAAAHAPDENAWARVDLRAAFPMLSPDLHAVAGKGFQMIHWDRHSQHCSVCGAATQLALPNSKTCPFCGKETFPGVTPAVLILVRKENSILLAHAHTFKGPFYSILAGFLEPGETLEECARREVLEETGLTVGNVNYFASQSWPFPSNLMIGFIADYESGKLTLQEDELSDGAFYTRDALPELPGPFSLSRRMINWWIKEGA